MQRLPYLVMAGLLIVSLAFWLVGGDPYWIVPLVVWPSIIAYGIWDRRQKAGRGVASAWLLADRRLARLLQAVTRNPGGWRVTPVRFAETS